MVTIIIPTYKRAKYLERAIGSILNQTYTDYEIIVVDDNNPNTEDRRALEEIMKKYEGNPKVNYVQHEKNKNGAAARNTGIKLAKGDYITFLDDDDYFLKDRLELMVNALENNKEYNAAYSSVLVRIGKFYDAIFEANRSGNFEKEFLKAISLIGTGSNMFFRAQTLKDINGFREEFLRHQDYEVLVRFFANENLMLNVDKLLVVKDCSDAINAPNSEKAIKFREQYLEYFKDNIEKYKDKNEIYLENYKDLISMSIQDNNNESLKYATEKAKSYTEDKKQIDSFIKKKKIKNCIKKIKIIKLAKDKIHSYKIKKRILPEDFKQIISITE